MAHLVARAWNNTTLTGEPIAPGIPCVVSQKQAVGDDLPWLFHNKRTYSASTKTTTTYVFMLLLLGVFLF